jgi:ankyrin repeat protein
MVEDDLGIHFAAEEGDVESVRRLIAADPSLVHRRWEGVQPLHLAAAQDHREVIELLLDHGAELNARGAHGRTPLHFAAHAGSIGGVYALILRGADLDARDEDGFTAQYHGVNNQPRNPSAATAIFGLLLRAGAALDLETAVCLGMTAVARDLLDANPDWCQTEPNAADFLSTAVMTQKADLVELLLERGADANACRHGPLPLREAVGIPFLGELLLRHGADPRRKRSPHEDSPLEWATRLGLKPDLELYARFGSFQG